MRDALRYCLESLRKAGVDKYQCSLTEKLNYELNLHGTEFSLVRTTSDETLNITVIHDNRKGDISVNLLDQDSIEQAVRSAIELSKTSQQDSDYDISPRQPSQQFSAGPTEPDAERMYGLLNEFRAQLPKLFPQIRLMETIFNFSNAVNHFINSNGVDFISSKGLYSMSTVFTSKDGEKTSSFNYTGFSLAELEKSLLDRASLKNLLQQSVEHLNAEPLQGKFVGDVIITPDCLNELIQYYVYVYLSDRVLISGTSLFKDALDQEVASAKLTLHSAPVSAEISDGYFVTPDGFAAENVTVIDKGVLKSFMLSLYGANKTKKPRAKNSGGCWVVEPGEQSLEDMIRGVKKGLLVARYSGGNPSANGDFSGVAKNSYYIENGKVMYPVNETMISGNLAEVFKNIVGITQERIDFGAAILPYIHTSGVTISGK